jgi:hypothetical protein
MNSAWDRFCEDKCGRSLSKNTDKTAVSAVAQNSDAGYLRASAVVFHGQNEPETLESLACQEALALASDLLIALDCLSFVLNLKEGTRGHYAHII